MANEPTPKKDTKCTKEEFTAAAAKMTADFRAGVTKTLTHLKQQAEENRLH